MALVFLVIAALVGGLGVFTARAVEKAVARRHGAARGKRARGLVWAIVAGLAAVAPLVVGSPFGDRVAVALGAKSRSEMLFAEATASLAEDPRTRASLAGKDADAARSTVAELTTRGVPLLGRPELERWAFLRLRLAEASDAYCAGAWRGDPAPRDLFRALDALSEAEQREWLALAVRAGRLALDAPSTPAPNGHALLGLMVTVADTLPAAEREAFERDVGLADPGEARACELFQLVLRAVIALPLAEREASLRALAAKPD